MTRLVHSVFCVALASVGTAASADSVKEISRDVRADGWFQSCSQALPRLAKVLEPAKTSDDWKAYVLIKAGCLSELRRDSEAVAYLHKKFADNALDADAAEYLATSYIRLGSYDDAARYLEQAIASGPKSDRLVELNSKLALAYIQIAGRQDSAAPARKALLKQAEWRLHSAIDLSTAPMPTLYVQLGQVQTILEDFETAKTSLDRARALNESYKWDKPGLQPVIQSEILMAMSQLQRVTGDLSGADNLAQQAMASAPTENLKIVMEAISASTEVKDADASKSQMKKSAASVLAQPYVPLDEEL